MVPGATGLPGLQNETLLVFSNVSHSRHWPTVSIGPVRPMPLSPPP